MNYWIFKTNPERYRIDEHLQDINPNITWRVTRYREQICAGDIAFIWKTGNPRGIIALINIESDPSEIEGLENEEQFNIIKEEILTTRIKGIIVKSFPIIDSDTIKKTIGLEGLSVFHGFQQGTNYPVTQKEAEILLSLIN